MTKQVLILHLTRMGDLVQTVPLLARLEQEWPGVAIDLVVDTRLAPVAKLLPGLRQVLPYDFQDLLEKNPSSASGMDTLSPELKVWVQSLSTAGYDRVINLTFTHWSGLLADLIGAPDTRGITVGRNGVPVLRNPWLTQVVDLYQHRHLNRYHLVDLYALGGSGLGTYSPIRLKIPAELEQWARRFVQVRLRNQTPIAVHVGAGSLLKAWRPELFGRTLAALSQHFKGAVMLTGAAQERASVQRAVTTYYAAGGIGTLCDAVGQTDMPQLAALLRECRLLLTNDTGPMRLAVGVRTPVIDLSVGHADFHDTGPYGPGHWVVQPVIDCAPCTDQQVCAHQSCKDLIVPKQLARLCLHVLGHVEFPTAWTGVSIYESDLDADGLACYRLRAGQSDPAADWYRTFWRRYWYETFTGRVSRVTFDQPAPDRTEQQQLFIQLLPDIRRAVELADQLVVGSRQDPLPVAALRDRETELTNLRRQIISLATSSPACGPMAVSFMRQLSQCETNDPVQVAEHQSKAYWAWNDRMHEIASRLQEAQPHLDPHTQSANRPRIQAEARRIGGE